MWFGKYADKKHHFKDWVRGNRCPEGVGFAFSDRFVQLVSVTKPLSEPRLHKEHVNTAISRIKSQGGAVGETLYKFLNLHTVHIVCFPGGPGGFQCKEESGVNMTPTIIWDPYSDLPYYSYEGRRTCLKAKMPAWVVLAHEIGHYRQYVTDYTNFCKWLKLGDGFYEGDKDNLKRHEKDILRAAGYPVRHDYKHLMGTTFKLHIEVEKGKIRAEEHKSWDKKHSPNPGPELIRRWNDFETFRKNMVREQKRVKAKDMYKPPAGTYRCACGQEFTSSVRYRIHLSEKSTPMCG